MLRSDARDSPPTRGGPVVRLGSRVLETRVVRNRCVLTGARVVAASSWQSLTISTRPRERINRSPVRRSVGDLHEGGLVERRAGLTGRDRVSARQHQVARGGVDILHRPRRSSRTRASRMSRSSGGQPRNKLPTSVAGTRRVPSAGYGTRRVPTTLRMRELFIGRPWDPPKRCEIARRQGGNDQDHAGGPLEPAIPNDAVAGSRASYCSAARVNQNDVPGCPVCHSCDPAITSFAPSDLPVRE